MEPNKILFLTTSILIYTLLSVFLIRIITTKFRKSAATENNFNYYGIILSGLVLASAILGKEQVSILKDVYGILQQNKAQSSDYFRIVAIFSISAIILMTFSYFLSFILIKIIFEKIKIFENYSTEQFGYFLLLASLIIMISIILVPLYNELLIIFSPKLKMGLYN